MPQYRSAAAVVPQSVRGSCRAAVRPLYGGTAAAAGQLKERKTWYARG